jgi:predicted nucleic acid-binding protein
MEILVDSNVILDILTEDPIWFSWSAETLEFYAETHVFIINPIIYSEVSVGFDSIEDTDVILPSTYFRRVQIPWAAAFIAGKCFLKYRQQGGQKHSPLPDFFIGAHAVVSGIPLMTRDDSRYRTYFPELQIISP